MHVATLHKCNVCCAAHLLCNQVCNASFYAAGEESCGERVLFGSVCIPLPSIGHGSQQLFALPKNLTQCHSTCTQVAWSG